jgi:hypothetical protein
MLLIASLLTSFPQKNEMLFIGGGLVIVILMDIAAYFVNKNGQTKTNNSGRRGWI